MKNIIDMLNEKYITSEMAEENLSFIYFYAIEEYIYFNRDICLYNSNADCDVKDIFKHCCFEYERYVNLLNRGKNEVV